MSSTKPRLTLVSSRDADAPADISCVSGKAAQGQSGDPKIRYIESLYNRYRGSLLQYLSGVLPGGRQDAMEILQETYVRLLRQENLDHLEENARAYIFAIATNLARDLFRRRACRLEDAHVPFDELNFSSAEPSPLRAASWEESLASLKQALLALNPLTRQVFILSRFEQLTYPEIAETLGISTRTVERHISAAFKELQSRLEDLL